MNNSFICQHCGANITEDMVFCEYCGCQLKFSQPISSPPPSQPPPSIQPNPSQQIVINNYYNNAPERTYVQTTVAPNSKPKDKWVAFMLCLCLGYLGAHKFYEGNAGTGVLYFLTFGLFGFGWIIDIFIILSKPNPYYV